jgi:hypothetical protein
MINRGQGYTLNDLLAIDNGNQLALVRASYVGVGNYRKFKGIKKSTAYWL